MIGRLRVSRAALRHNASALRDLVAPSRAAFVLKSNAYGHGLAETARAIEPYAALICTYALEEALELRAAGIGGPILILGPIPPGALDDAVAAGFETTLWDAGAFARELAAAARKRGARARVHVKVNTGLNRLGLNPPALAGALEDGLRHPEIEIAGVYSHLSSAEELDSPATVRQLGVFERALGSARPVFEGRGIAPLRHIAASAAAMLWPQTRLDLARFGIATYGVWPSEQTREAMTSTGLALQPALTYRSEIAFVREVSAGAPIGYGASYHTARDGRIGIVPVGYADGVPRALSNRGAFLVDGARCRIVGRVAMNVTEIDLWLAPAARPGSRVTLIGTDGDARIDAGDWAEWAGTIGYEIVARLPREIPRVFDDDA